LFLVPQGHPCAGHYRVRDFAADSAILSALEVGLDFLCHPLLTEGSVV
jgi:hypothetical protein